MTPPLEGRRTTAFIEFNNAFFIKLGRGGAFEADSIDTGKMRFGWQPQSLERIKRLITVDDGLVVHHLLKHLLQLNPGL
jgi:hypothetical protein